MYIAYYLHTFIGLQSNLIFIFMYVLLLLLLLLLLFHFIYWIVLFLTHDLTSPAEHLIVFKWSVLFSSEHGSLPLNRLYHWGVLTFSCQMLDKTHRYVTFNRSPLICPSCVWLEVDSSHPDSVNQWILSQDLGLKYCATFNDFANWYGFDFHH